MIAIDDIKSRNSELFHRFFDEAKAFREEHDMDSGDWITSVVSVSIALACDMTAAFFGSTDDEAKDKMRAQMAEAMAEAADAQGLFSGQIK